MTVQELSVDLLGDLAALDGQSKVGAPFEHRRRTPPPFNV
jgi:hypothetical protein